MKKFLASLAYYAIVIIVSARAGIVLSVYVMPHTPWQILALMGLLTLCAVAYIDSKRFNISLWPVCVKDGNPSDTQSQTK